MPVSSAEGAKDLNAIGEPPKEFLLVRLLHHLHGHDVDLALFGI